MTKLHDRLQNTAQQNNSIMEHDGYLMKRARIAKEIIRQHIPFFLPPKPNTMGPDTLLNLCCRSVAIQLGFDSDSIDGESIKILKDIKD